MQEQTNNKTIAKNTVYLYFRSAFSMFVSFFTSRVILQVLGVTDMGIQASVGGVVSFLGFLNGALCGGTSRFITYSFGEGDIEKTKTIFNTVFWVHAALSAFLVVAVETVGLWFLYNKLIIPADRMDAAVWIFHLSVLSMAVGVTQVPYGACVVAHEKMDMYAYTGIIDTILKLAIVYALMIVPGDKLKWYASFFFITSTGMMLFYRWYCTSRFEECKLQFKFDKAVFKPIAKYSGWQLFAQTAIALNNQGVLILLNMFFSPAVVAARSISLQVNGTISQFIANFRSAANPQIVKSYAAGNYVRSKSLLLESTKYCYYLMLMMTIPVFLLSSELLYLWLSQVPEYTVIFLKLVLIQGLFQIFDTGLYTAISAHGNIKPNALTSPIIGFCAFPLTYLLFRLGCSPIALSWVFIVVYGILAFIQKPWILVKIVGYKWSDFVPLYGACFKVTILSSIVPFLTRYYIDIVIDNKLVKFLVVGTISVLSVAVVVWGCGINKEDRAKLINFIKSKLHH